MFPSLFALFAHRKCLGVLFFLLLIVPGAIHAQSSPFAFRRVTSDYRNIQSATLDDGQLAFAAQGPDGVYGIHVGPIGGPYTRVVDNSSVIAGAEIPLRYFVADFGFEAGHVAFYGGRSAQRGIYLYADGVINRLADQSTLIPGTEKTFGVVHWPPSVDNGLVAFDGQSGTTVGVTPLRGAYLAQNGELARIADTTMPTPGDTRNFNDSFSSSIIDGDRIAFIGNRWNRPGIYLHDLNTGTQKRVIDTNTIVPGHATNFASFDGAGRGLDMDGDRIGFLGSASQIGGVYVADTVSGSIVTVAENGMLIPGSASARFERSFTSVSIDDGRVVFG